MNRPGGYFNSSRVTLKTLVFKVFFWKQLVTKVVDILSVAKGLVSVLDGSLSKKKFHKTVAQGFYSL